MKQLDYDLFRLKNNMLSPQLKQDLSKINLLTEDKTNAKLGKNQNISDYKTYIMYLSPYKISGLNVCPHASIGCAKACLNTAGRGRFSSVQNARLRKTLYYRYYRLQFIEHLIKEIQRLKMKHPKLAVRLNGTSDLNFIQVIKAHLDVQFYDYTPNKTRVLNNTQPNYDLTFSQKEDNHIDAEYILNMGHRVAVVFDYIPVSYKGFTVVNGDNHDLRFLDKQGVVIGLSQKADAKLDDTGFVQRANIDFKIAA